MGTYSQLKKIKNRIRYLQLDNVIGSVVNISGLSQSESEIRNSLKTKLPDLQKTSQNDGLIKYRSIYIDFELSEDAPDCPLVDLGLLREVGLLPTQKKIEEWDSITPPEGQDFTYLDMILEDLEEEKMWVKLFLEPRNPALKKRDEKSYILKEFLPTDFIVVDACQTNVSMIWFMKHFYM